MSEYYLSAFVPAKEGGYVVLFPDVPEAGTQGETLIECMENAMDALSDTLADYASSRKPLPVPSDLSQAMEKTAQMLAALDEPVPDGILYQLVPAPSQDLTPVKISISVGRSTLERIDQAAKKAGMTRSGYLVRAADAFSSPEP